MLIYSRNDRVGRFQIMESLLDLIGSPIGRVSTS